MPSEPPYSGASARDDRPLRYIICGIEHIGARIAASLFSYGEQVTTITLNAQEPIFKNIQQAVVSCVHGDARCESTLREAGVEFADILFALTSNDIKNLEICLKAKSLNPAIAVIAHLATEDAGAEMESGFGLQKVLNMYSLAALHFAAASLNQSGLSSFELSNNSFIVIRNRLQATPELKGKTWREVETSAKTRVLLARNAGGLWRRPCPDAPSNFDDELLRIEEGQVIVSRAVDASRSQRKEPAPNSSLFARSQRRWRHLPFGVIWLTMAYAILISAAVLVFHFGLDYSLVDAFYFVITTTTTVGYGDFALAQASTFYKLFGCFVMVGGAALLASLFGVITDYLLHRRLGNLFKTSAARFSGHFVVVGFGKLGYRIVQLLRKTGLDVVVVETNSDHPSLGSLPDRTPVIIGDAANVEVLNRTGIRRAQAIISVIGNDLKNLNIILQSRKIQPEIRSVVRIFSTDIEQKARDNFGIQSVLTTSGTAAPFFMASAFSGSILTAFWVDKQVHAILEIHPEIAKSFEGQSVQTIFEKSGLLLFASRLDDKTSHRWLEGDDLCAGSGTLIALADYKALRGLWTARRT
jgi:Trk K+ transport system NAD-binding subunit